MDLPNMPQVVIYFYEHNLKDELTSKMAGTGIINSKYRVDFGKRNMSSNIIAFTAPLAP